MLEPVILDDCSSPPLEKPVQGENELIIKKLHMRMQFAIKTNGFLTDLYLSYDSRNSMINSWRHRLMLIYEHIVKIASATEKIIIMTLMLLKRLSAMSALMYG